MVRASAFGVGSYAQAFPTTPEVDVDKKAKTPKKPKQNKAKTAK